MQIKSWNSATCNYLRWRAPALSSIEVSLITHQFQGRWRWWINKYCTLHTTHLVLQAKDPMLKKIMVDMIGIEVDAQYNVFTNESVSITDACENDNLHCSDSLTHKVIPSPTDRRCQDAYSRGNTLLQWWNSAPSIMETDRLETTR